MKRWIFAPATLALGALAVPSASAHHGYSGSGVVTGAFGYSTPLPGTLKSCKPTAFTVTFDAPAFSLTTPEGPVVSTLAVRGQGASDCESADLGAGKVAATIEVGALRCDVRGGFTRLTAHMTLIMGGPCAVGTGDNATTTGSFNWLFELTWAANGQAVAGVATIDL